MVLRRFGCRIGDKPFTIDSFALIAENQTGCFVKLNIDTLINISDKKIFLDPTYIEELDEEAELTFYNVEYVKPKVLKDGNACSDCTEVSYTNNTYIVNVNGFSMLTHPWQFARIVVQITILFASVVVSRANGNLWWIMNTGVLCGF